MPREAFTRTASPGSTIGGVGELVEVPCRQPRRPRALQQVPGERPDAHHHVELAREGGALLAMQGGAGGPELQHVTEHGHPPAAGGHAERDHRRRERVGARVVAVVDEGDAFAQPPHLAAVARRRQARRRLRHGLGRDPLDVGHRGGGQEVRDEVGAGERKGHLHGRPTHPQVEAHAEGGAPPPLRRYVAAPIAAEPDDALLPALAHSAHPRVVAVQDCHPVGPQALQHLRLGLGDGIHRGEELEVDRRHPGDDRDVRLRDRAQGPQLSRRRHAQLEHGRGVLRPQAQEGEGQAVAVVQVPLGLEHRSA